MKNVIEKNRPYADLPLRKQRDEFIRLRWRILQDKAEYGGLFTSDEVMDAAFASQCHDFLFLGSDGYTIWNASISTAAFALQEAAEARAFEQAEALLSAAEREVEFHFETVPVWHGGVKYFQQVFHEPRHYPQFDGLTFAEFCQRQTAIILAMDPPLIHESFLTNASFRYGIGLDIIRNVPSIDPSTINAAIADFFARGESDWESPEPVRFAAGHAIKTH